MTETHELGVSIDYDQNVANKMLEYNSSTVARLIKGEYARLNKTSGFVVDKALLFSGEKKNEILIRICAMMAITNQHLNVVNDIEFSEESVNGVIDKVKKFVDDTFTSAKSVKVRIFVKYSTNDMQYHIDNGNDEISVQTYEQAISAVGGKAGDFYLKAVAMLSA